MTEILCENCVRNNGRCTYARVAPNSVCTFYKQKEKVITISEDAFLKISGDIISEMCDKAPGVVVLTLTVFAAKIAEEMFDNDKE